MVPCVIVLHKQQPFVVFYHFLYEWKVFSISPESVTEESLFSICPKITAYAQQESGKGQKVHEKSKGHSNILSNATTCSNLTVKDK